MAVRNQSNNRLSGETHSRNIECQDVKGPYISVLRLRVGEMRKFKEGRFKTEAEL